MLGAWRLALGAKTMTRVITTLILAAAVLAGIWYLPPRYFEIGILLIVGLGLWEYSQLLFKNKKTRLFTILLGLSVAGSLSPTAVKYWDIGILVGFAAVLLAVFLAFLWSMRFQPVLEKMLPEAALIFFGVCYLGLTIPFWSWIQEAGPKFALLVLFPAALTDTFGFLVGKAIGRHKLAPRISPNKTWEGAIAGLLGGGIFGWWLAYTLFFQTATSSPWYHGIPVGLTISLLAILGDLVESLIKRSVGVKDSSHLIPGHGGVLDRLDALIFVAPFFHFYMLIAGFSFTRL